MAQSSELVAHRKNTMQTRTNQWVPVVQAKEATINALLGKGNQGLFCVHVFDS